MIAFWQLVNEQRWDRVRTSEKLRKHERFCIFGIFSSELYPHIMASCGYFYSRRNRLTRVTVHLLQGLKRLQDEHGSSVAMKRSFSSPTHQIFNHMMRQPLVWDWRGEVLTRRGELGGGYLSLEYELILKTGLPQRGKLFGLVLAWAGALSPGVVCTLCLHENVLGLVWCGWNMCFVCMYRVYVYIAQVEYKVFNLYYP